MQTPFAPHIAIARPGSCSAPTLAGPRRKRYPTENEALTLRNPPGDASCQKTPQDASPNFDPPTQHVDKEGLATS
jgi:hypothetical protein